MKKNLRIFTIITTVIGLTAVVFLRFFSNGGEDTWVCINGKWVEHGKPTSKKPDDSKCKKTEEISIFKLVNNTNEITDTANNTQPENTPANDGPPKYVRLTEDESKIKILVQNFYDWYLDQLPKGIPNYKDRAELTSGFKMKLDSLYQNIELNKGMDPIFLSQDIPDEVTVEKPAVKGNIARVQVDEAFGPGAHVISVALIKENGFWKISDVLQP